MNTPQTARAIDPPTVARAPLFELVAVPLLTRKGLELVARQNRWEAERLRWERR